MSFNAQGHFNASTTFNRSGGFQFTKTITELVDAAASIGRAIARLASTAVDVDTGTMLRKDIVNKAISAAVDVSATVSRSVGKILTEVVDVTGTIKRGISRIMSSQATSAGSLVRKVGRVFPVTSADVSGSIKRGAGKVLSDVVDATGSIKLSLIHI